MRKLRAFTTMLLVGTFAVGVPAIASAVDSSTVKKAVIAKQILDGNDKNSAKPQQNQAPNQNVPPLQNQAPNQNVPPQQIQNQQNNVKLPIKK